MKVKRIRVKSKEDFFYELEEVAKRLAPWHMIRGERPRSILELSRMTKRDFKSVHRDVAVLVGAGIVEPKEGKGARGNTQQPLNLADSLLLEVA